MDTFTKMTVEERISTIHYMLKDMFPDAVNVSVFVNSEGIDVTPVYRTNISGHSMKSISGNWVKKV
jgi:hypothetical protein